MKALDVFQLYAPSLLRHVRETNPGKPVSARLTDGRVDAGGEITMDTSLELVVGKQPHGMLKLQFGMDGTLPGRASSRQYEMVGGETLVFEPDTQDPEYFGERIMPFKRSDKHKAIPFP